MDAPKSTAAEGPTIRLFLLLLAAALLAAFPWVVLGRQTFFYRDFGALGYPGAVFTRDCLWRGEWPLWNPYSHCGVPWLAQMGQWYPPDWLACFLPLPWAKNFLMLAHLWFGGCGMYWLLQRWRLGHFAAAFAGFAFVFNGITLSCLLWDNYIAALAWLPWVTGCAVEAWRQGGRWLALAAVTSALQVLTATPELTLLTWLFLGMVWLADVFSGEVQWFTAARRIGTVVLLAAGITMIQMLPFFDLLAHSQRNSGSADATVWSMPGWGWANLLVPLFHCYQAPQGPWFQHGQEFLASYYLGIGVLILAIIGAMGARTRIALVAIAMSLFCWIAALGPHGFFYSQIRKVFPLIGIARFPIKFTLPTAFLVPLLAAWGMEHVQGSQNRNLRRGLAILGVMMLVLMAALLWFARQFPLPLDNWNATATNALERAALLLMLLSGIYFLPQLKNPQAHRAVQWVILAILPFDALTHSPQIAPTLPAAVLAPGLWQASGKPPVNLGEARIMITPDAEHQLLYSRVADLNADFLGKRLAEWYNLNLLDGLPKVTGAVTLRPAHFDILEKYLYYTAGGHCGRELVDFLSVAWLSAPNNPTQWQARTNYLPVITAGQKPVFAGDKKTLAAITAENFDPRQTVYLPKSARAWVNSSHQTACVVSNVRFGLNRVEADINATAPALVVLSQSYYHLWHAFVDGKPAALLRANLAFQAVPVPAGAHHLKLIYRDLNLVIGAMLTLLSLTATGLIWLHFPKIH
ncbi:MAG TPA: YfhO family protein [Verrucomicrobiae bacterium]|nr:YfhO family protein [Verrucomicrobiae bacterium]